MLFQPSGYRRTLGNSYSYRLGNINYTKAISVYHGVYRDYITGKWLSRMWIDKYRYNCLGFYETEVEAARAFDIDRIKKSGRNAVTNFDIRLYDVNGILNEHAREVVHLQFKEAGRLENPLLKIFGNTIAAAATRPYSNNLHLGTSSKERTGKRVVDYSNVPMQEQDTGFEAKKRKGKTTIDYTTWNQDFQGSYGG
ncbi:AP2-like ethylene-responsive transcription factor [Quillaja saponaria]|uniref:AP2-like ethylene-responsive transcription factor n=1 Tax=Quillaja saponaria TaxID=32244 RepID=A0AAD7PZV0_QUISA|nr:AP2-like ethylene-responsive transcription factor [Quillaja saponaria]